MQETREELLKQLARLEEQKAMNDKSKEREIDAMNMREFWKQATIEVVNEYKEGLKNGAWKNTIEFYKVKKGPCLFF